MNQKKKQVKNIKRRRLIFDIVANIKNLYFI